MEQTGIVKYIYQWSLDYAVWIPAIRWHLAVLLGSSFYTKYLTLFVNFFVSEVVKVLENASRRSLRKSCVKVAGALNWYSIVIKRQYDSCTTSGQSLTVMLGSAWVHPNYCMFCKPYFGLYQKPGNGLQNIFEHYPGNAWQSSLVRAGLKVQVWACHSRTEASPPSSEVWEGYKRCGMESMGMAGGYAIYGFSSFLKVWVLVF